MLFIVKKDRTVESIIGNLNIGDTATDIVVVTPFTGIQTCEIKYTLPNGQEGKPAFATFYGGKEFENGSAYVMKIPKEMNAIAGEVRAQIILTDTSAKQFASTPFTFPVDGITALPFPDDEEQGSNFAAILKALAATYTQYVENFENAVKEVTKQAQEYSEAASNSADAASSAAESAAANAEAAASRFVQAAFATTNSKIRKNEMRITNLEKGISPDPYITDDTATHIKDVPAAALPYAEIEKVGGMSRTSNNLLPFPIVFEDIPQTISGVRITYTKNHGIRLKGMATVDGGEDEGYFVLLIGNGPDPVYFPFLPGTYTLSAYKEGSKGINKVYLEVGCEHRSGVWEYYTTSASTNNVTFEILESDESFDVYAVFKKGIEYDIVLYPMLNKGGAPLPYEKYFKGYGNAALTEIKSYGKNLINPAFFNANEMTHLGVTVKYLPEEDCFLINGTNDNTGASQFISQYFAIENTPGTRYTLSAEHISGTMTGEAAYFYAGASNDENFRQNWLSLQFSKSSSSTKQNDYGFITAIWFYLYDGVSFDNYKVRFQLERGSAATEYSKGVGLIESRSIPQEVQNLEGYGEANPDNAEEYNYIDFEAKKFVAYGYLSDGVWVAYDAPQETDVSAYFDADDDMIEVEAGGSLVFVNEDSLEVPSAVTYMVKENEA